MITLIMLDGRYVNGTAYAPGERVQVAPAEAHEIVAQGWAKYAQPEDAARAHEAFKAQLDAQMRRIASNSPVSRTGWLP